MIKNWVYSCFILCACLEAEETFISSVDPVPEGYNGLLYSMHQDYPKMLQKENHPWEQIDFRTDAFGYLMSLREYFYEGMFDADFRSINNNVRGWYDMPWMHVGFHPRECIRGMTRERDMKPFELGPLQHSPVQNWAVGFFNPCGGYAIGKVWNNPSKPDCGEMSFPIGSVITKALFTSATPEEAPQMEGSLVWTANINSTMDLYSPKKLREVRLMQLDVAVRDSRADSTTGWVFGSYVYDRDACGDNPWLKMVPVGLSWGNDPGITPKDIANGKVLQETIICDTAPGYARDLLGWAGRMNGPADNHKSSCLSCHSCAQLPHNADMVPFGSDEKKLNWFRNVKDDEAFSSGSVSAGYSLQMAISIQNFYNPEYNENMTEEEIREFELGLAEFSDK